jgi:suppressor of fused protein SUFU
MVEDGPVSLSRDPVWQHSERAKPFEHALGDPKLIKVIDRHIAHHIGPVKMVYHEMISDLVHVDVHHVEPTPERPFHFLVTSGMSERPMIPPEGAPQCRYAELFLALPPSWPMNQDAWRDEAHYWPIRQLKANARFPHALDTWLWHGHTLQSSPPDPYATSTRFNSCILGLGSLVSQEFAALKVDADHTIAFFALQFLYPEELQLKMARGADFLFDRLEKYGITELVEVNRRNVGTRWWHRFGGRA